ncbi:MULTISPECIES: glycosyl hydrolase family 28-related protein [Streptomyces]|uniref:Glycosyl hydrolase family 28-related protein n=1 Tax=Streptomyces evansiae TaxID=3075535 RepID=A0ABU2R044_9ACTN|nr:MULTISPECIES: glycosyl hydrolase family 28-related protein [unclassified Streptomyces]MDT0409085.1 glycosyl hydrolase family 28-related protein [Streptomyces sp. DSM 41979]MYQ59079.1 mycodextranase [Streptomyces sp. SID4926]
MTTSSATPPSAPRRLLPLAVAVAAAATTAALLAPTASAAPRPAAPRPVAPRPAAAAAGASLPFTSVEAEDAESAGTVIGPDHTQGTVASESSGRRAVRLGAGQSITFTAPRAANALTVAYNIADGRTGDLALAVNGEASDAKLALTSKYSYVDTPWIVGAKTHHLLDNARVLLGQDLAAGDTVTLTASAEVTVDVADFEQVAAPATRPAGSVSVVDHGADPSGQGDSTQAFREAIAAAKGGTVWIPEGDYAVNSSLSGVEDVTLQGAGSWYSVVHSSSFINQSNAAGGAHLKDFAVIGEVTERNDSSPDNFVNGSLGPGSSVSGMWLQHLKVGLWLTGNNDDLVVEDNRIVDTTADGLNLNGSAKNVEVRQNFLRNNGDDALAMWSLNAPDTGSVFDSNTISQPNLANGIAIYGGTDITVSNNLVSDTNALGSGIAISNQKFADPFFPLAGTITVSGNTLVRTGALNPNWGHPMGALRVDAYDSDIEAKVNITDTTFTDSPYGAFEFVSGGGTGKAVRNVTVDGATVDGAGTVVVQAETPGQVAIGGVHASGVGAAGTYNCPFPEGSGTFTLDDTGDNSGWDTTWDDCATWPEAK